MNTHPYKTSSIMVIFCRNSVILNVVCAIIVVTYFFLTINNGGARLGQDVPLFRVRLTTFVDKARPSLRANIKSDKVSLRHRHLVGELNSSSVISHLNFTNGTINRISDTALSSYQRPFELHAIQSSILSNTTMMSMLWGNNTTTIGIDNMVEQSIHHYNNHSFGAIIGEHPVFVMPMVCASSEVVSDDKLGRCLERYFHALAITMEFGLHFVPIPPPLPPHLYHHNRNRSDINSTSNGSSNISASHVRASFFEPLFAVYRHTHPTSLPRYEVGSLLLEYSYDPYFGSSASIQWSRYLPIIRERLHAAFDNYRNRTLLENTKNADSKRYNFLLFHRSANNATITATIHESSNNSAATATAAGGEAVVLYFPCIRSSSYLKFHTYSMVIPRDAKNIVILTDPSCSSAIRDVDLFYGSINDTNSSSSNYNISTAGDYHHYHHYYYYRKLLLSLVGYLQEEYSGAIITMPIYATAIDTMVRIADAAVFVSPPSSTVFWGTMVNNMGGETFMAPSVHLFDSRYVFISDRFYWLSFPKLEFLDAHDYCGTAAAADVAIQQFSRHQYELLVGWLMDRLMTLVDPSGESISRQLCQSINGRSVSGVMPTIPIVPVMSQHKKEEKGGSNNSRYDGHDDHIVRYKVVAAAPGKASKGGAAGGGGSSSGSSSGLGLVPSIRGSNINASITTASATTTYRNRSRTDTGAAAAIDLRGMLERLLFDKSLNIKVEEVENEIQHAIEMNAGNRFSAVTKDAPVFVYPLFINQHSIGNHLGRLFQAAGIARDAGLHFIVFPAEPTLRQARTDLRIANNTLSSSSTFTSLTMNVLTNVAGGGGANSRANTTTTTTTTTTTAVMNTSSTNALNISITDVSAKKQLPPPSTTEPQLLYEQQQQHHHHFLSKDSMYSLFLESFSFTIEHESPSKKPFKDIMSGIWHGHFDQSPWLWEYTDQPWSRNIDLVRSIMKTSMDYVVNNAYPDGVSKAQLPLSHFKLYHNNSTAQGNQSSSPSSALSFSTAHNITTTMNSSSSGNDTPVASAATVTRPLAAAVEVDKPFVPEAVIKIRCNDVLTFPDSNKYGFIDFLVYQMAIPTNARSIYILAEPQERARVQKHSNGKEVNTGEICDSILTSLVEDLSTWFPSAFVGLIRGGDVIDAMVQMTYASTVISSSSTLSLWAMLANDHPQGRLLFPTSNLIMAAKQQYMSDRFYWMDYPRQTILSDISFGEDTKKTLADILAKLRSFPKRETTMTRPQQPEEQQQHHNHQQDHHPHHHAHHHSEESKDRHHSGGVQAVTRVRVVVHHHPPHHQPPPPSTTTAAAAVATATHQPRPQSSSSQHSEKH